MLRHVSLIISTIQTVACPLASPSGPAHTNRPAQVTAKMFAPTDQTFGWVGMGWNPSDQCGGITNCMIGSEMVVARAGILNEVWRPDTFTVRAWAARMA